MDYDRPLFFHVMEYASAADRDVVDMVSGNPDWEPPGALRDGLREYADSDVAEFQYPASDGLRELREEIAARRGVDLESVVVTNGAGEANHLAMSCGLEAYDGVCPHADIGDWGVEGDREWRQYMLPDDQSSHANCPMEVTKP